MARPRRPPRRRGPGPLKTPHLADSTVWAKALQPGRDDLAEWFNLEARGGRILTCQAVALELLRSARNSAAFQRQNELLALLRFCPIGPLEWERARQVQALLAARGEHKGVPPQDLLIAAAAEAAEVPVLHYDHDYDLIARVTGQPMRWFVTRGSLS